MLEVNYVKSYLVIPTAMTESDALLNKFIDMAKVYLGNAVDNFETLYASNTKFQKQADQWMLFYVAELYQNRLIYAEGTEPSYHLKALMIQLQTYYTE